MAYCVKCKGKREMRNPSGVVLRNRKRLTRATAGTCHVCGTKMYRIER